MEEPEHQQSIVQYLHSGGREKCGYCKTGSGFKRFEFWAFHLTVEDYQSLIDRGWRRSGHYCYKPILSKSCCPMYTIRCDATEFRLSKSQKRVLKAMNYYLHTGNKRKHGLQTHLGDSMQVPLDPIKPDLMEIERKQVLEKIIQVKVLDKVETNIEITKSVDGERSATVARQVNPEKAKVKRIRRKLEKLQALGLAEEDIKKKMIEKKRFPVIKRVEDFIDVHNKPDGVHRLEVRLVRSSPRSAEFNASYETEYQLYKKYQMVIHKDPAEKISQSSFDNFLVDSPLYAKAGYGSFHQQYWLRDKLIAVGVVDILPRCLSSVYLFYDPDYAFLHLGTYSALREVYHVRSMIKSNPRLTYYYLGFYIHSCKKMSYKAAFKPAFLLCPEVNTWHSFVTSREKIEVNPVSRLNEDPNARDDDGEGELLHDMLVIYHRQLTDVGSIPFLKNSLRDTLIEFTSAVGKETARRIILQLVNR